MERDDVLTRSRLAGSVERYHVWPTIQKQPIGLHVWNIFRLYYLLFGPIPTHTCTAIIWHDAGELVTGDIPFGSVKSSDPKIKAAFDAAENVAVIDMGGPGGINLIKSEQQRIKVCDLLDMMEFGIEECRMGNQYAEPIIKDTYSAIKKLKEKLTHEERTSLNNFLLQYTMNGEI